MQPADRQDLSARLAQGNDRRCCQAAAGPPLPRRSESAHQGCVHATPNLLHFETCSRLARNDLFRALAGQQETDIAGVACPTPKLFAGAEPKLANTGWRRRVHCLGNVARLTLQARLRSMDYPRLAL